MVIMAIMALVRNGQMTTKIICASRHCTPKVTKGRVWRASAFTHAQTLLAKAGRDFA